MAIPSPELIIGSVSSLSQLLTLGFASLGGAAALGLGFSAKKRQNAKAYRRMAFAALALLVIAIGSLVGNVSQYYSAVQARQDRLEATLVRPSRDPGAPVGDPTLREYSFQQQNQLPTGISTEDAAKLMDESAAGKRDDVVFVDMRETAETEMGTLKGATIVRGPDMRKAGFSPKGKTAIFFCHNGNRSAENCEQFKAGGGSCRFVVGGLEKWVVEGRGMTGMANRTLDSLRAIPDYANSRTLLDTPEVHKLISEENAQIIDLRYPGEFAQRRMPGAINFTVRTATTEAVKDFVASLPKRPIFIPCYDRRSCFFGEVMGLELVRAGHDYRGRYTLPWEYFTESTRPPHVVEWQQNNQRSYWSRLVDGLAGLIQRMSASWPLALILVGLALLSRLIVLPVSLKAERDQIVSKRIEQDVAALKQRFADDPVRLRRAMKALFDTHGMTPGRNMLGLLFLPVLAISVVAIEQAATQMNAPFLWLPSPAARDHLFILPLLFGAALALYLDGVFGKSPLQRTMIWLGAIVVFGAMTATMGSAANFYVVVSAVFILLQRLALTTDWKALAGRFSGARKADGLPTLDQPDRLAASGNKALRLAKLRAAGVPVPDGVVLDAAALSAYAQGAPAQRDAVHAQIWRALGDGTVAVRSSAAGEDGAEHSFAGVFDSVINVDRNTLADALGKVIASFRNDRAGAYGVEAAGANILIQKMVDAQYAGVLFTRSPGSGGEMMIEMVEGTADAFVSGAATPRTFRFGAATGKRLSDKEPPMDLTPLLAIGRTAEALFGNPQDIEWTFRDGSFQIVQSRDITQSAIGDPRSAAIEEERARLLRAVRGAGDDEVVLVRNGLSELLPRPTPLSLSLMEDIWRPGGSVDLACRSLDLEYRVGEASPALLVPVFGRLYVDRRQEAARAPVVSRLNARRLLKRADELEQHLRETVFDDIQARYAVASVADFQRVPEDQLVATLKRAHTQFVAETYAAVEAVNVLSELFILKAQESLRKADLDPGVHLAITGDTFVSKVLAAATAAPAEQRRDVLLQNIGHRAAFDYELATPRYAEAPEEMEHFTAGWTAASAAPEGAAALPAKIHDLVEKARRFQRLKEDAKHMAMKEVAVLRQIVLALDIRLGLGGDVFWLTFDELLHASSETAQELASIAARRKAQSEEFRSVPGLPAQLTAGWLETASLSSAATGAGAGDSLRGTRVAGSRAIEGRARVIPDDVAEAGRPIADIADGDIIVAEMIPHAWLPYFRTVEGVVSEVGGFLSHTAIVAREFDLSMVVGVANWRSIRDGDWIRVEMDGSIAVLDGGDGRLQERLAAAE